MFSKIKKVLIKLFSRKADEVEVVADGPREGCFPDCADDCPAREPEEFQGLEALIAESARNLAHSMERSMFAPTYTYRVVQKKKPKKKAKKKKSKKKVHPKGKYGSQKKASPIKKTKPSKKGI